MADDKSDKKKQMSNVWQEQLRQYQIYASNIGFSKGSIRTYCNHIIRLAKVCPSPFDVTIKELRAASRPHWSSETRKSAYSVKAFYIYVNICKNKISEYVIYNTLFSKSLL